jgi:hypothetical protein
MMMPVDLPLGVAEYVARDAVRGRTVPFDFVLWLAASPRMLDVDQCTALAVGARSWVMPRRSDA